MSDDNLEGDEIKQLRIVLEKKTKIIEEYKKFIKATFNDQANLIIEKIEEKHVRVSSS